MRYIHNSAILILVNSILNRMKNILQNSFIIKLLVDNFSILLTIFLFVAIITPDRYWHNQYTLISAIALLITFICKILLVDGAKFNIKLIDISLWIFLLSIILATFSSLYFELSIKYLIINIAILILFLLIISDINKLDKINNFIETILVAISLTGVYGIWQLVTKSVHFDSSLTDININYGMPGRIFSTMGNPNNYSELLVLTLPFFAAIILNAKNTKKRILFIILSIAPILAMFLTGSRSGWGALCISVGIFIFIKNKKLIPIIILLATLSIPFIPDFIYRRFMTIFNSNDGSNLYRMKILKTVSPMLKDNWLMGVGLGTDTFVKALKNYYLYAEGRFAHCHVLFLQIWVETGLLGIVSFIWFIIRLIKRCICKLFDKSKKEVNNILIAGVCSIIGIMIIGSVDYIWFYPRILLMFWVIVGVIIGCISITQKGVSEQK